MEFSLLLTNWVNLTLSIIHRPVIARPVIGFYRQHQGMKSNKISLFRKIIKNSDFWKSENFHKNNHIINFFSK